MNVSINEGRHDKPTSRIDLFLSPMRGKLARNFSITPILDSDVNKTIMTMKPGMADDEVILHMIFLFKKCEAGSFIEVLLQ